MSTHPFFSLFDDPDAWQIFASGQAEGRLTRITNEEGKSGLRLDYDFHGGGGFVVIRRVFEFTLPDTFQIGFELRGDGPPNHFEFKVAAPGGTNVWRHLRQDFQMPREWIACHFSERELPFAWGPAGGGAPSGVEAIEFVIAAGPGGKGVMELISPSMEDQTLREPQGTHASSHRPGFSHDGVFGVNSGGGWRADFHDAKPWWAVDFGRVVRFGGLVIDWPESLPSREYVIEISHDGETWRKIYQATCGLGARSYIPAPAAESRHLRFVFGNPECAALNAIALRPDAFSRTPNEFVHSVAADLPRGMLPRYWSREQSYWTPVGSPEGKRRALINEEGMVETDEAGFSFEPFILVAGKLVTWADVKTFPALPKGGTPLPMVVWKAADHDLKILPWVDGKGDGLTLHVTYRLKCRKPMPDTRLLVAVRPLQVNPPWQAFRNLGGSSPIHQITCDSDRIRVNDKEVTCSPRPSEMGAAAFEEGGVLSFLAAGMIPPKQTVRDEAGHVGGLIVWDFSEDQTLFEATVSYPYFANEVTPAKNSRAHALARWRKTLGKVDWQVPACAEPAFACFRTAAGHILINRDGPAIQPGPRRYTRSWVRDCVIMGAALAKAGLPKSLRVFLTWYARFQREDGFIPCVVDRDGVDWLVEHDSHGQFLWGIREVFRNDGDKRFAKKMMPGVGKAADYLIALRALRMTEDYQSGEHAACYGLLPESASHEGYLAHPVHSYWDDFWGVRGLEAAADLASALGLTEDSLRWKAAAADFQEYLLKSIDRVIADKKLSYIPGSVEWADFDPTATSNAIAMLDFADALPPGPLHGMLETYLDGFHRKHRGEMQWNNYTAYEIRIIGAFVRLGKRAEANELLEFFLSDRRPLEWNQWPEITWKDPRSPGHLGDVPHTWIAAEYLLAVASMVASEREATASLVLASGMPWAWISSDGGFGVKNLPTRFGGLDFQITATDTDSLRVEIGDSISLPPGGLTIVPPLPEGKRISSVKCHRGDHSGIDASGQSLAVTGLPLIAEIYLTVCGDDG
jgi:hypothetical protein